ncbi:hypothetical protein [Geminocystis sp.]|uniref:hypothetical protein n=1 Tax=Geminocystis sp. TaxID=2664100 RepID=UPI0035944378
MANCPECGSDHIQFVTETVGLNTQNKTTSNVNVDKKINWGRAVVGGLLFGGVGAIIGATTGKNQEIHTGSESEYSKSVIDTKKYTICLDCGSEWNPQDIYNLFKLLQELNVIEERLDLSKKENRLFLKNFTMFLENEIEPISNQILTEKQYLAHSLKSYLYNKYYEEAKEKYKVQYEKYVTYNKTQKTRNQNTKYLTPVDHFFGETFIFGFILCIVIVGIGLLIRFFVYTIATLIILFLIYIIICEPWLKKIEQKKQEKILHKKNQLKRIKAKINSEARIKSSEMYELEKIESEKLMLEYEETINLKMTEFIEMNKDNLILI